MTPALRELTAAELFDWLRLTRSDKVGPRTFRALLQRFGSARAALDALPRLGGAQAVTVATPGAIEAELAAADKAGLRFLPVCSPSYPPSLRAIADPPPILAVRGRLEILQRSMVAVVGSRNASAAGLFLTERLVRGIGGAGHAVVSGLARGIDARAHLASLETGAVAVLAGGHNRVYPADHRGLADRIAGAGAVLSEMPIDWEPRGRDFPRRNRIVSGLALGVVVVEAARRSGSLITARFGNEQGREVFAVPGHPTDPRAEGTNDLLKAGATVCTVPEDVTGLLEPMVAGRGAPGLREPSFTGVAGDELFWDEMDLGSERPGTNRAAGAQRLHDDDTGPLPQDRVASPRDRLADLIGAAPVSVDDLVRTSELPARQVQAILVELELEGLVRRQGGGVARALA